MWTDKNSAERCHSSSNQCGFMEGTLWSSPPSATLEKKSDQNDEYTSQDTTAWSAPASLIKANSIGFVEIWGLLNSAMSSSNTFILWILKVTHAISERDVATSDVPSRGTVDVTSGIYVGTSDINSGLYADTTDVTSE